MSLHFYKKGFFSGLRQIISFLKKTRVSARFFALSLFFSLCLTLFNLYTVSLLLPLAQGIVAGNFFNVRSLPAVGRVAGAFPETFKSSLSLFVLLVFWIYGNILVKNLFQYISSVSSSRQAKEAIINMRGLLFERCLKFGQSFYDRRPISDIHRIVTQSSGVIGEQFHSLQGLIVSFFLILMYLGAMLRLSWKLCLVAVIAFPFLNIMSQKIIDRIRQHARKSEDLSISLSNRIFDVLAHMPVVQSFAKEDYERRAYQEASRKEAEEDYRAKKVSGLLGPVQDVSVTTSILFLAFGMVWVIYVDKSLAAANAFVFFYLAQNLIGRLNSLNGFQLNLIRSARMVDDINGILEEDDGRLVAEGKLSFSGLKDGLSLRGLDFSYADGRPVLSGLDLEIPAGKMTAIVGRTGSGKSTIAKLLLRFYDCPPDSILADGSDIRKFSLQSWRKRLAFVSQDSLLFNDTVRYNIAYGLDAPSEDQTAIDERVAAAGRQAEVEGFVSRLPDGYETLVGENGAAVSGGEKQRIAIARSLIKGADILILDEATSALDPRTEKEIVEEIRRLMAGKTLIVISHRLVTVKAADKIVFLENGKIEESGGFESLLARRGRFYESWKAQEA